MPPTLHYSREFETLALGLPEYDDEGRSYELLIYPDARPGESTYRAIQWDCGDWHECLTKKQYKQRVADIVENETQEIADLWEAEQDQVVVIHDSHPVWALIPRWEAMIALDLFHPQPTLVRFTSRPLAPETLAKMDALRDRWMAEESAAMAAGDQR